MFSYYDFLEVIDRAQAGPDCIEKQWDTKILPKLVQEKVQNYIIEFNPDEPVPSDNSLIDNVYQAGFELAVDAGVLCTSTEKRILFTEGELKAILREIPSKIRVGRKSDSVEIVARTPEDSTIPKLLIGPIGIMVTEEMFIPICYSYLRESITDTFDGPTLEVIHGRRIRAGTPLESIAARLDILMVREACKRANKENIAVIGIESSPTYLGHISAGTPQFNFHATDIQLIPFLSELKTNWGQLNKVSHSIMTGGITLGYMHPMIGGYVGGPAGAAITLVAAAILLCAVHCSKITSHYGHDFRYQGNTSLEGMWAQNIGHQALSRNTHLLHSGGASPVAGCCTEMLLYETAASAIGDTVTGGSYPNGVRTGAGVIVNGCSGLEARFFGEITRTVPKIGLNRNDANQIVLNLFKKYKDQLSNPPKGKTFTECYDVAICKPKSEWINIYNTVRGELAELGLDLDG